MSKFERPYKYENPYMSKYHRQNMSKFDKPYKSDLERPYKVILSLDDNSTHEVMPIQLTGSYLQYLINNNKIKLNKKNEITILDNNNLIERIIKNKKIDTRANKVGVEYVEYIIHMSFCTQKEGMLQIAYLCTAVPFFNTQFRINHV
jgi:hypothetical protein